MDCKLKHLEFIQGVINRLASDSFRMKRWSVVLISALLVLLAREGQLEYTLITLVLVFFFWGLDGYFLLQERLFRALYDHVRALPKDKIDFSMDVGVFRGDHGPTWLGAVFSTTLAFFHGMLLAVTVGLAIMVD